MEGNSPGLQPGGYVVDHDVQSDSQNDWSDSESEHSIVLRKKRTRDPISPGVSDYAKDPKFLLVENAGACQPSTFHPDLASSNIAVSVTPQPLASEPIPIPSSFPALQQSTTYSKTCTGPYVVIITALGDQAKLHPMSVGRKLRNIGSKGWNNISRVSLSKVRVEFSSRIEANKLVNNLLLKELNITATIPKSLTQRMGVVRDVDVSLTTDELLNFTVVPNNTTNISAVRRMTRTTDGVRHPLPVVVFTFEGTVLPPSVSIDGVVCRVSPYVAGVLQCRNCLRFGHSKDNCRSQPRCASCAQPHESSECASETSPQCLNCGGPHVATSKICPAYAHQQHIKKISAEHNVSYKQAQHLLSQANASPVVVPSTSDTEFPPLSPHVLPSTSHQSGTSFASIVSKTRVPAPRNVFPYVDNNDASRSQQAIPVAPGLSFLNSVISNESFFDSLVPLLTPILADIFNIESARIEKFFRTLPKVLTIINTFYSPTTYNG